MFLEIVRSFAAITASLATVLDFMLFPTQLLTSSMIHSLNNMGLFLNFWSPFATGLAFLLMYRETLASSSMLKASIINSNAQ